MRMPTFVRLVTSLMAIALIVPAGAGAAPYIVNVKADVEPLDVARTAGVTATYRYDTAMRGFAADMSSTQLSKVQKDARVLDVVADTTFSLDATSGEIPPGHPAQFTTYGQDRIGLLQSRTADVDGVDERVDADVAIIDSGVAPHLDLNVAGGVDCTKSKTGFVDEVGHGTTVAGFVGALDNAFGVVGVAPGARIWAVRVGKSNGSIQQSALLCGLEWVRDNAAVIDVANLSLGMKGSDTGQCGARRKGVKSDPLHAAICSVVEGGVTVVVSAGNDSASASTKIPAAYPEVITVSAFAETDGVAGGFGPAPNCLAGERDDYLASFSNFGSVVDLAAPGVCVTSTTIGNAYVRTNGTSFAAPHVAGAAALIRATHPGMSPAQVQAALRSAAEYAPLGGDPDGIAEPILNVEAL